VVLKHNEPGPKGPMPHGKGLRHTSSCLCGGGVLSSGWSNCHKHHVWCGTDLSVTIGPRQNLPGQKKQGSDHIPDVAWSQHHRRIIMTLLDPAGCSVTVSK
jgi:hypothetical protein